MQSNRGMKFDLCLKGCLGSKRTASYDIKVHVTMTLKCSQINFSKVAKFGGHSLGGFEV